MCFIYLTMRIHVSACVCEYTHTVYVSMVNIEQVCTGLSVGTRVGRLGQEPKLCHGKDSGGKDSQRGYRANTLNSYNGLENSSL